MKDRISWHRKSGVQTELKPVTKFQFWFIILQLELEAMIFARKIPEENFLLYKDVLAKIVPWFSALDHTNYAG